MMILHAFGILEIVNVLIFQKEKNPKAGDFEG